MFGGDLAADVNQQPVVGDERRDTVEVVGRDRFCPAMDVNPTPKAGDRERDSVVTYQLGIDIGGSWTKAALCRNGDLSRLELGDHGPTMASVVYLRVDGVALVGSAAAARRSQGVRSASGEQERAALLHAVLGIATEREGTSPSDVVLTHPSRWSTARIESVRTAIGPIGPALQLRCETDAVAAVLGGAAPWIPAQPERTIALYDLGGATFQASVLRHQGREGTLLGRPEVVEGLGGTDIDGALFGHVRRLLGPAFDRLDTEDAGVAAAVGGLRAECVTAKELLSSEMQVTIPVLLPGIETELLLTRAELEVVARPALQESIAALRRALSAAGITPSELDGVMIIGGAGQLPIVGQMLSNEFGRPVLQEVEPGHLLARGAALLGAEEAHRRAVAAAPAPGRPSKPAVATVPAAPTVPAPAGPGPRHLHAGGPIAERWRRYVVGIGVLVVVGLIGAVLSVALRRSPGGTGDGPAVVNTSEPTNAAPSTSTADPGGSTPTTTGLGAEGGCTLAPLAVSACIAAVTVDRGADNIVGDEDYLVASFRTGGFEPGTGTAGDHVLHFYFPVAEIAEDIRNAGTSGPSPGGYLPWAGTSPWRAGKGSVPFSVGSARRVGASQLCVLVADDTGAILTGTGSCAELPASIS